MAIHPPRYPKLNIILESFWPFLLCPAGHPALSVHSLNISNHFSPFSQPSLRPPSSTLAAFLLVFLIPLLSSSNSLSKTTIIYFQGKLHFIIPLLFLRPPVPRTHTHVWASSTVPSLLPCVCPSARGEELPSGLLCIHSTRLASKRCSLISVEWMTSEFHGIAA